MSKVIAELLGIDRRTLDTLVQRLEHMTMQPSVDVRLTAKIITQSREKVRAFGYDPANTTAEELYYGLLAIAEADDSALRECLSIKETTTPAKSAELIAKATTKLLGSEKIIALQAPAVKRILSAVPPKKTLKLLKFRSIDSVLKREDPNLLYALAMRIEDKSWHTQISARLKRLETRDAQEQSVKVLSLPKGWIDKLKNHPFSSVVSPIPELGSIILLPSIPTNQKGAVLLTSALVLQAGQRLSIESLPYRKKMLSNGIETIIPEIAAGTAEDFIPVHGLKPTIHAVYQLLLENGENSMPDYELILGDLRWESTETKLASICRGLDRWVDSHYLGYTRKPLPISMHLIDVSASLVLQKPFGQQVVSHMRASIWNELQLGYLRQESIERAIINQLSFTQGIVL